MSKDKKDPKKKNPFRGRPIPKSRIEWAIRSTLSIRAAAQHLGVAYNTFKKYAKLYEVWAPLESAKGISQRGTTGFKPVELAEIFSGKHQSYSATKLLNRCFREGYLEECCGNCGYDEYRPADMRKPLMLDYLDDDPTNKDLGNLRLLCFNCFFLLKLDRLEVKDPANVRSFKRAVKEVFETDKESILW